MSMSGKIRLSKESQELITVYTNLGQTFIKELNPSQEINYEILLSWLTKNNPKSSQNPHEFIFCSLQTSLLNDLLNALGGSSVKNFKKKSLWANKLKFILLAASGTLLAACEGFDNIITMLGGLSAPAVLIILVGIGFSLLSVLVFYGFDLVQVAKNLNVTLKEAPLLLDVYLLQLTTLKEIKKKISDTPLIERSPQELHLLINILDMLQTRSTALAEGSAQFKKVLNSKKLRGIRLLISSSAGLIFFGGGFFAGQSVALFFASLALPSVLPTFWPVILCSVIVGLAAFSLYWYVEQEGLKNLVNGWFGLDSEKIERLCDEEVLNKEHRKIVVLKEKIEGILSLTQRLNEYENKDKVTQGTPKFSTKALDSTDKAQDLGLLSGEELVPLKRLDIISENRYVFYSTSQANQESNGVSVSEYAFVC